MKTTIERRMELRIGPRRRPAPPSRHRTLAGVCLEMGDQCGEVGLLQTSPRLAPILRHAAAWRIGQSCLDLGTAARPSFRVGGRNGRELRALEIFAPQPLIGACQSSPNDDRDEWLPHGN
jgi:hypothetical protein